MLVVTSKGHDWKVGVGVREEQVVVITAVEQIKNCTYLKHFFPLTLTITCALCLLNVHKCLKLWTPNHVLVPFVWTIFIHFSSKHTEHS